MTWSVLQSASTAATSSTSTTVTCTYGSNVASGTKLICYVSYYTTASSPVVSVRDAALNSMTKVGESWTSALANDVDFSIWAMDTPAGDVGAKPVITVTIGSAREISMVIQEVSGLAAGNTLAAMVDGTAAAAPFAAATSAAQPAYNSTASGEFLVSFIGDGGAPQVMGQPAGYTLDAHAVNNSSQASCCPAYKSSTGGAESGTWTLTGSNWPSGIMVVAFNLAATGTDTTPVWAASQGVVAGGTGSWVNPGNATGAADASFATWTAP